MFARYLWTATSNVADCHVRDKDLSKAYGRTPESEPCLIVPGKDCMCGLYAVKSPELMSHVQRNSSVVCYGLVSAYGRIIEHTDGNIRAEVMEILALAAHKWSPGHISVELLARAAGNIGVPYQWCESNTSCFEFLRKQATDRTALYGED